MSTVIECPECSTRYKMNKAIPEGGRYVKCARCGHQWRVIPEEALSGAPKTLGARQNIMVDESVPPPVTPPSAEPSHGGYADDSWQARREFHAFAVSSMQNEAQTDTASSGGGAPQVVDRDVIKNAWMDYDTATPPPFGSASGTGYGYGGTGGDSTARYGYDDSGSAASSGYEAGASDDPEGAIRSALNAALEQPGLASETAAPVAEKPFNEFWEGFASERESASSDSLAYGGKDLKTVAAEIESARRSSVIYDAVTARDGFASGEDAQDTAVSSDEADSAIQSALADSFRAELAPKVAARHGGLADGDENAGVGGEEGDGYHYDTDFLDGDTASLRNQLEKFGHMPYEEPRRGGLAAVAAWAVFLSLASGMVLALVNFRNDIVAALPGTAGLYSLAGLSTAGAGQPLDFSNVTYRWTVVDGKPMVEVTGQVVNRSDRTVQVPQVLVNMRDSTNSDPVRTTASVQSRLLDGGKSADFALEFAVSKDINQIELAFDSAQ